LAVLLAAANPTHPADLVIIPGSMWAWLRGGWRRTDRSTLILLVILAAAAALRLPALDSAPAFVHSDEARNGLAARLVADGQARSLFSYGFADLPQLGFVWDAMFLKIFGDSLFALRLSSAVVGIGSILLVAQLGEELISRRMGLLAAAWLAAFHMHIHYSRLGHHYIQALFTLTLTLYLFARALRTGARLPAVACGLALAVDIQVYFAARIALAVVPLTVLYLLLARDRGLPRPRGAILGWLPLGFVVGAAPIGALIASSWGAFTLRTRQVLVIGGTPDAHSQVIALYGRSSVWHILREQFWAMLQTFNYSVDTSLSYLLPHQLLDPVSAALLPAALIYALYSLRGIGSVFCLGTFAGIVVTGGALTIGQPYWPRLIALLPILALLLAFLLDGLWSALEQLPRLALPAAVGVCALLVTIAYGNLWWYFGQYLPSARQNWLAVQTEAGEYLHSLPDHPSAYGLADPSFLITTPQIRFLAPGVPLCTVAVGPVLSVKGCPPAPGTDRVFLLTSGRLANLPALRRQFQGGTLHMLHRYTDGRSLYAYRVQGHT
jgi:4-amino-4-deoxy-L-arabinose transferase-like glycosyltransferase